MWQGDAADKRKLNMLTIFFIIWHIITYIVECEGLVLLRESSKRQKEKTAKESRLDRKNSESDIVTGRC